MIDGLKFDMKSAELLEQLGRRVSHHAGKAAFYEQQVKALKDGGVGAQHQTNDPVSGLQKSAVEHNNKMLLFKFMYDHVIPNEVYRINEQDLLRLEILERIW
jgi:hypothetical protein